ncbi:mucin-12-like [Notechis scutatus]|uniref:Mucin-12-like n=1 Tax=Notechis scutatus TaxID=8663 RepID=A0A6J1V388_9SAUR|nr:mucin-12-like [Notechis scutatus]
MAKNLLMVLLLTLLSQVFCLQCNTCHGEYNCVGQNMTCEDSSASCTTSVRKAHVSFLEFQTVRKGCARQLYPFESFSMTSHLVTLSYQANYCAEDGCNNETYFVSHPAPTNHMRCHTCASQGAWCPEASRTQISCVGHQEQCVDLDITGKLGPYSNLKLKGCANLPRCEDTLSFYSGSQIIHASCCNTPLCNTFTPDLHLESQAPNGLECYSCVDGQGSGGRCSNKTISKVKCTGVRNMCLEGIGNSRKAGEEVSLVTFKGCASPAMCQSSLLELVQELEDADIICCQGNLCNNRIVDGVITEPRDSADSPENTEDIGCVTFDSKPSEPTPKSDCFDSDEMEDLMVLVDSPPGEGPSSRNHTDKETVYMVDEKKASENLVNESHVRPSSHHDQTFVGGKPYEETLSGNSSESRETSFSTGDSHTGHGSSGSSLATTNLETSNSTSGYPGGVALLIPFIVPQRNKTASPTTPSPIQTSTSKEVLIASSNDDKCETKEKCLSSGGHFIVTKEKDHEGSSSSHPASSSHGSRTPVNTSSSAEDAPDAGNFLREGSNQESESYSSSTENIHNASVLAIEEHGAPHSPATNTSESTNMEHGYGTSGGDNFIVDNSIPVSTPTSRNATSDGLASNVLPRLPITSIDNSSFIVEGKYGANASSAANTKSNSIHNPGMGLVVAPSTSRPKTKTPCNQTGCENPFEVNLVTSFGAAEEEATRNASTSFFSDPKSPEHNTAVKEQHNSGALGLATNLGLFSLTLLLAALT